MSFYDDSVINGAIKNTLLLDDYPICQMDGNVLSPDFKQGLSDSMLGTTTYFRNGHPAGYGYQAEAKCLQAKHESLSWLAEFCGLSMPSRSVLVTDRMTCYEHLIEMEKRQAIRSCVSRSGSDCLIVRFFDLRDAIELVVDLLVQSEHPSASFLDEFILATLAEIGWTEKISETSSRTSLSAANFASLSVTLNSYGRDIEELVSSVIDELSSFGRILGVSEPWLDTYASAGQRVKFFIEYFDCMAAEHAMLEMSKRGTSDLLVAFCCLHNQDREYLLFQKHEDPIPATPTSLSSESKIIKRPGSKHQRTFSTISSTFSSLVGLSENEATPDEANDEGSGGENWRSKKHTAASNELDMGRIENGLDTRTTCMIKNIPNKYTQQMLIDHLDETHTGRYDFIYLRMDFKNKCNVGYAFINFLSPSDICSYARRMVGKGWPRFNSEKRCELAYARIQGKAALLEKFRNSRVMQEPPSYRPRVFDRSKTRS